MTALLEPTVRSAIHEMPTPKLQAIVTQARQSLGHQRGRWPLRARLAYMELSDRNVSVA